MKVAVFEVETSERKQVVNITADVLNALEEMNAKDGFLLVTVPHATASIVVNEGEPGLMEDITAVLERIVPQGNYRHNKIDDNAEAHIKSALCGPSVILPVKDGRILRGTWQDFLLLEHDGPRVRKVIVAFLGEFRDT